LFPLSRVQQRGIPDRAEPRKSQRKLTERFALETVCEAIAPGSSGIDRPTRSLLVRTALAGDRPLAGVRPNPDSQSLYRNSFSPDLQGFGQFG